jgi:tetratricopeptide (TPR) repeat protein
MRKNILNLLLGITFTASYLNAQNPAAEMWNDPSFIKSFTGSYGILSKYEPEISDLERDALRILLPLIRDNPKGAIAKLEPQIQQSSSAALDFLLANLHFQQGDLSNAEKYYKQAVAKHPHFRRAHKNLGLVYVQQGNFKASLESISTAIELGDVDGRSYGLLGYGYLSEQLYYPAETAYRHAMLMQPKVQDWKIGLARCLVETRNYANAIALFDTLIKEDPDNSVFWVLQANAYLGSDLSIEASKNLEVVRRMGKADFSTLTLLGDIYMNNDSTSLALSAYLEAIEIAGTSDPHALIRAASLFTQTINFKAAKTLVAQVRQHYAGKLEAADDLQLLILEAKIARGEGDDEAAVVSLNRIVERDALNGAALIELANIYAGRNDMPRAITRYQQAARIQDSERAAVVAHAQALVRKSDYQQALPLLRRALSLKPDNYLEDYTRRVESAARDQI